MSGRKPGDPKDPATVEATLDDLLPVDSDPSLAPVTATLTLDEEDKPAPSATQILDPMEDVVTSETKFPKTRPAAPRLDVSANAPSAQARRRAALKSDAFESFPALSPARAEDEQAAPRGPPPPWKPTSAWTPGLVAMAVMFGALLLVTLVLLLRS